MDNEQSIKVLNKLIQINNDRIEGYEKAAEETEEEELKDLFGEFTATSQRFRQELSSEVITLGGTPTDDTKNSGKFFRAWMDVKAALTGKDRKAIISSCEYGEDMAKETYEEVLEEDSEDLTTDQRRMVEEQLVMLKADHDTVRELRDMAV